jgi:hypothetical protein
MSGRRSLPTHACWLPASISLHHPRRRPPSLLFLGFPAAPTGTQPHPPAPQAPTQPHYSRSASSTTSESSSSCTRDGNSALPSSSPSPLRFETPWRKPWCAVAARRHHVRPLHREEFWEQGLHGLGCSNKSSLAEGSRGMHWMQPGRARRRVCVLDSGSCARRPCLLCHDSLFCIQQC